MLNAMNAHAAGLGVTGSGAGGLTGSGSSGSGLNYDPSRPIDMRALEQFRDDILGRQELFGDAGDGLDSGTEGGPGSGTEEEDLVKRA